MSLTPLRLAHVMYDPTSPASTLMAYVTFCPQVIVIAMSTLVAFRRDLETAFFLAGLVANTVLCVFLKRLAKQPRPETAHTTGYGMPSNHSQFMAFFAVFAALLLARRVRLGARAWNSATAAAAAALALLVAYSRLHLGAHTPAQVAAGLAVGAAFGGAWYAAGDALVRPRYAAAMRSRLGRALCVRDLTRVDNVLRFDHERTAEEAAKRGR